jgi:hypothetical protein
MRAFYIDNLVVVRNIYNPRVALNIGRLSGFVETLKQSPIANLNNLVRVSLQNIVLVLRV